MAARAHALGGLFVQQNGTDGQAAAQTLSQRDDVRLEVVVPAAQEGTSGPTPVCTSSTMPSTRCFLSQSLHGLHTQDPAPSRRRPLALDQLQHHGAGGVSTSSSSLDVTSRGMNKPCWKGPIMEHLLTGGGQV